MPPLNNGDRFTFVQRAAPRVCFVKYANLRDEGLAQDTRQDITGWTIQIIVKRNRYDPDAQALFSPTINAPGAAAAHVDGTPLSPTLGEWGWDFTDLHTFFPPGVYFGEINFWTSGASYAAGDEPYERYSIEWEILPRTDR